MEIGSVYWTAAEKKEEKNVSNPKQPNFGALYLTQFLTDFGQILDSKSNDQAPETLWYHTTPRP